MTLLVFLGCCSLHIVAAIKQKNDFRTILEVSSSGYQQVAAGKQIKASFAHRLNRSEDDSHRPSKKAEVSDTISVPAGKGVDEDVFLANLALEAERYDDMIFHVKAAVSKQPDGLSVKVRDLLSLAYKGAVKTRRDAWRVISEAEKEEVQKDPHSLNAKYAEQYRILIETEIRAECEAIFQLLDGEEGLISKATGEDKVFYLKMKGDYWRYLAEILVDDSELEAAKGEARDAYEKGQDFANNLEVTNAQRLGLALNFSVFYYDVLKESHAACAMTRKAFEEAILKLDNFDDPSLKDTIQVMQLLRDNLTLWTSDEWSGPLCGKT